MEHAGDFMGSIKTSFVKRIGNDLFENNSGIFTNDYSKNKEIIKGLIGIKSKKMRNIIAGYVTNLKNQEKKV